jgi:hypothetical protein
MHRGRQELWKARTEQMQHGKGEYQMKKTLVHSFLFVFAISAILLASNAMAVSPRLHREIMLQKNMARDEFQKKEHDRTLGADKHLANITNQNLVTDQAKLESDMKKFGWDSTQAKEDRETVQKDKQTLAAIAKDEKVQRGDVGEDDRQINSDEQKLDQMTSH